MQVVRVLDMRAIYDPDCTDVLVEYDPEFPGYESELLLSTSSVGSIAQSVSALDDIMNAPTKVFVYNIAFAACENKLKDLFGRFIDANIVSKSLKKFAFVVYANLFEALSNIRRINGQRVCGVTIAARIAN
jgi:hypothetical protein